MYTVYVSLCFPNNKLYFGITSRTLARRIWEHRRASVEPKYRFHRALKKHGADSFVWYEIGRTETWEDACDVERALISYFRTRDPNSGYNDTDGGDRRANFSPEVLERIGAANRGKKRSPEARAKMCKRVHSEATRQKMREAHLGRPSPHRGVPRPEAVREKIRATMKKMYIEREIV